MKCLIIRVPLTDTKNAEEFVNGKLEEVQNLGSIFAVIGIDENNLVGIFYQ